MTVRIESFLKKERSGLRLEAKEGSGKEENKSRYGLSRKPAAYKLTRRHAMFS